MSAFRAIGTSVLERIEVDNVYPGCPAAKLSQRTLKEFLIAARRGFA